eukprot:s8718_g2.t1
MAFVAALLFLCQGGFALAAANCNEDEMSCMIQMPTNRHESLLEILPYETTKPVPVGFNLEDAHISDKARISGAGPRAIYTLEPMVVSFTGRLHRSMPRRSLFGRSWGTSLSGDAAVYRDGLLEAFQGFTGDMSVSELLNASASCCPNMHGCYDAFTITGISIHMQSTGLKKHYETTLEGVIRNKLERAFTRAARGGFAQRFARQRRRWISSGRWCRLRRSAQSVESGILHYSWASWLTSPLLSALSWRGGQGRKFEVCLDWGGS